MEVDQSGKKHKEKLRELIPGNYFGEISVLYNCDYSATVKALNYGTYGIMDNSDCHEMFKTWPEYKESMISFIMGNYNDDFRCFILQTLRRIKYLENVKNIPDKFLIELAY